MAREYKLKSHREDAAPAAPKPSGIDYHAELNDQQIEAVTTKAERALVIAGAGSGKTRTLTYRVAWLLDHKVSPANILLLTFTNKAAKEMITRVRDLVGVDTSDLWAGTFHSIGARILRRHAEEIGFTRSFSILDRDDQKQLLSACIKDMDIDTTYRRFPKAEVLASIFSLADNTETPLEEVVAERGDTLYEWLPQIEELREKYIKRKQEGNSMDFDDLICLTANLLEERPDLTRLYQQKFRHVLVDEYQDTNRVQARMIDLLSGGDGTSLMAVGDDSQSIYSWRGADVGLILGFTRQYHGAKVFTIETNYRSVPEILDLSNAAIRANAGRFEKNLRSYRDSGGAKPALVALEDPSSQAAFVAQRIEEMQDEGVDLNEIVVLYRAHFQSLEIQLELTRRGVSFAITSGIRFFEQAHVKDVTALMRFVVNRRDEVSFLRFTGLLPGCGPASATKLWSTWLATGLATAETPPESWTDAIGSFKVPKKAEKHWEQLCHVLDELTPDAEFASPGDMIFSIVEGFYQEHLDATYENADSRRGDLEKLAEFAADFENVEDFLEQLSLLGNTDDGPAAGGQKNKAAPDDSPKVTLSSIHQAKGLEWEAVFLIWLADGQFPNGKVLETGDIAALEEERRLFYVALTRAKNELYLAYPMCNPRSYSGEFYLRPSRFLNDFPKNLVEEWRVRGNDGLDDDEPF
ncbi:MAG: ATP-dependent helicase [Luteolibacter sp.]|jgi:DNA helicase II / ATP-dependent DNA helicase PcrA